MKFKYIIPAAVAAALSACSLDYEPVDTYSDVTEGVQDTEEEVVFRNKADVESYMQGMYKKITDQQEHWYLDLLLIAEAHSDNAYAGTTGAEVQPYEDNSIEGSNSVIDRDWNRYLGDVAVANKLIQNVDKVADGSLSQAEIESYRAQAQIFRSMIWFDMVRLWGDIPVIKTVAGDITADNIEEVYPAYFPEQSTELEAYQAIEEDMLNAVKYAPDQTADKTRFTKNVARTLLAKIYAEKPLRDYSKVVYYVNQIEADGFDLVDDYSLLFGIQGIPHFEEGASAVPLQTNTKESILEGQFPVGAGNWCTWMFGRDLSNWDNNFTWAKWITPSRDLIALFESEGDTKRLSESVAYYECAWSNYYPSDHYPFMYKCRSAFSSIIKYRFADLLLLKAEALIMGENMDLGGAADIIDRVRNRAGLGKLPASVRGNKEQMLNALLKERRLELAFEGQRWFDLVRLNKVEEVMNTLWSRDSGRHAQKLPFTEFSYRLPLPQSALDANDNLVQNPGY